MQFFKRNIQIFEKVETYKIQASVESSLKKRKDRIERASKIILVSFVRVTLFTRAFQIAYHVAFDHLALFLPFHNR